MVKNRQEQLQQTAPTTIHIQYYRSTIGFAKTQKEVVKSVGLSKLNQIVERPDTPAMRGFVRKVPHLLRIVDKGVFK